MIMGKAVVGSFGIKTDLTEERMMEWMKAFGPRLDYVVKPEDISTRRKNVLGS